MAGRAGGEAASRQPLVAEDGEEVGRGHDPDGEPAVEDEEVLVVRYQELGLDRKSMGDQVVVPLVTAVARRPAQQGREELAACFDRRQEGNSHVEGNASAKPWLRRDGIQDLSAKFRGRHDGVTPPEPGIDDQVDRSVPNFRREEIAD